MGVKNLDWTKLPSQLDVPLDKGLPDILVRLAYLEAMIETLSHTLLSLCETIRPASADTLNKQFRQMLEDAQNKLTSELVSKYHRSDAPDERELLGT